MTTIAERLQQSSNRPSGFDYMRLFLAIAVICWHVIVTSYGDEAEYDVWRYDWWWAPLGIVLPMFFSLSGFLVAGSLERCRTLISFLGLRIMRIVPALFVETCLSALILGPVFTSLPLATYFSSAGFHGYFLNIVGDVHFRLPGVFEHLPHNQVNGQLWTVPWELGCYLTLTVLSFLSMYQQKPLLLYFMIGFYVFQAGRHMVDADPLHGLTHGSTLIMNFASGLLLYRYRDRIVLHPVAAFLCLIIGLVVTDIPDGDRFAALPIAYMTVYFGLFNPPRNRFLLSGDYSYGLFLYGFAIQQVSVALGIGLGNWVGNLLFTLPVAGAVAALSWHFVEKPILARKGSLIALENVFLRLRHADTPQ